MDYGMENKIQDLTLKSIIEILEVEFSCHTIILYGSRARGDFNDISDYDVIGFSDDNKDSVRKAKILDAQYLDLWVYPTQAMNSPDQSMSRVIGGVVLRQRDRLGDDFLSLIEKANTWQPSPEWDKNLQKIWALKMFERAFVNDIEGKYRKHWLVYSLLEMYFQLQDLEYTGSKIAFKWLQGNDEKIYFMFKRSLESESLVDLLTLLFQITQKEKKYYFMRHAEALEGEKDELRPVSLLGKKKLKKTKEELGCENFDLVITSSATRTKQTAHIIFSGQSIKEKEAKKLYLPTSIELQFLIMKDLRLKENLIPNDIVNSKSRNTWFIYAMEALIEIMKINFEYNSKKTIIIGHGVVINLIGYLMDQSRDDLLKKSFDPGEGFWVQ
jgi:predicted nucleotidyltransferase